MRRRAWRLTARILFVLVALAIPVGGLAPGGLAAQAAPLSAPSLGIIPGSGPAGLTVTATGSGWTPSNAPYKIFWEVKGGTELGGFGPNGSGSWSQSITIPASAGAGAHAIIACEGYTTEFEQCASASYTVAPPSATSTKPPSATPTKPRTPTRTPTITPTPTATVPPTACGDLGLGPDAQVMTFDEPFEGASNVLFEFSAEVEAPTAVRAHSGTLAARSRIGMEFGSALMPITMAFDPIGATAVGMFVGLDTAVYVHSDVTATLQAFGYHPGGDVLESLGQAAVTFPGVPTDIQHCLVFRAAEGDTIARVEVEYTDAAGITLADPRWIDDVTIVWAAEPLREDDQPPVVDITQPEGRTVLVGGSVDLRATITEDRNLDRVWYRINGGPDQVIGYSGIAGDPTHFLTGFGVTPLTLMPYADNTIDVFARDAAGLVGSDRVVVYYNPPTPTPTLDIDLYKIEITQAIQCLENPTCPDNSVLLFTGKPTLVRVYLRSLTGEAVSAVSGELCYTPVGGGGGCLDPLGPAPAGPDEDPVPTARATLAATLNFLLPPDAVADSGRLTFSIDVNNDHSPSECCYLNNHADFSFRVLRSKRLDVVFVPIQARGARASLGEMWRIMDWLTRAYPTSDIRAWTIGRGEGLNPAADDTLSTGGGCGSFWDDILDELWWFGFWEDDPVDWMRYYGMVDQASIPPGGFTGCGKTPGYEAGGIVGTGDRTGGETAAQEIGHNHDRAHAPGCSAGSPDGRYPMGNGLLDEWGIDVGRMQLYDPSVSYDFMGYCGSENDTWVSVYTYYALYSALRRVADAPGSPGVASPVQWQAGAEALVASGEVAPDSVHITRGFYRLSLAAGTVDGLPDGPYTVELADPSGAVLSQRTFGPAPMSNESPADDGPIQLIVPWVEGASQLVFRYQGTEIARYTASANPPEVHLVSPNGGEAWPASGSRTIRWESSDADGGALTYAVQISADDGQTWRPLVDFTTATQVDVDMGLVPGSQAARVRVVASDGFNTAMDVSDAAFTTPGKGPYLAILSPDDGTTFADGRSVVLTGAATDLEDGPIDPSSLAWASSLDGDLGTGGSLWGLELSPGRHRITLTATDRSGQPASESVTIIVGSQSSTPQPPSAAVVLWLAGLALVGLAGAGFLLYALRSRPRSR